LHARSVAHRARATRPIRRSIDRAGTILEHLGASPVPVVRPEEAWRPTSSYVQWSVVAENRSPQAAILDVVVDLIESEGYDGVVLRMVAQRAHVGLDTIYRFFPSRDDLLGAAVAQWMRANSYSAMTVPPANSSIYDGLMMIFRHVFEPFERNPRMLDAFYRTRTTAAVQDVVDEGDTVLSPVFDELLSAADPAFADDVHELLHQLAYAALGRFVDGDISITEILPLIERGIARLTTDNASLAESAAMRRRQAISDAVRADPGVDPSSA
jgi:AcrR family transcriptional regulator